VQLPGVLAALGNLLAELGQAGEQTEGTLDRAIRIKRDAGFSGAPSGWGSGQGDNRSGVTGYCIDCLVNVNPDAGLGSRSRWRTENCALPIRGRKDPEILGGESVFVAEAVRSAVNSIGSLGKPDDVGEEEWQLALRSAAQGLVDALDMMGETAPEHLVALATTPDVRDGEPAAGAQRSTQAEERDISLWSAANIIQDGFVEQYTSGEVDDIHIVHDLYIASDDSLYAITSMAGLLYRWPVTIDDAGVPVLGEASRVQVEFVDAGEPGDDEEAEQRSVVFRGKDGRYRMASIVSTSILNRSGEIDSRALFDSFVANWGMVDEHYINFHHQGGSVTRLGEIRKIWREGYTLLAYIEFDDTPHGRAAAETLRDDSDGKWGFSIEFFPHDEPAMLRVAEDTDIPVYQRGHLVGASILKESKAAAHFTLHGAITREAITMDKRVKEDLIELVGDENAEIMATAADGVNRRVRAEGLIAREKGADAAAKAPPVAREDEADQEGDGETLEFEIDVEDVYAEVAKRIRETILTSGLVSKLETAATANSAAIAELQERVNSMADVIATLTSQNADASKRLRSVEERAAWLSLTDEEKVQETVEDMPRAVTRKVIVRPSRRDEPVAAPVDPLADLSKRAAENMDRIFGRTK